MNCRNKVDQLVLFGIWFPTRDYRIFVLDIAFHEGLQDCGSGPSFRTQTSIRIEYIAEGLGKHFVSESVLSSFIFHLSSFINRDIVHSLVAAVGSFHNSIKDLSSL